MSASRATIRNIGWLHAPVVMALFGGSASAILLLADNGLWIPVLYMTIGLSAWLAWRGIRWSDKLAKYFSLGAILLLVCMFQRVLYLLDCIVSDISLDKWPFYKWSPQWAMFKGEMITLMGTLLVVLAWCLAGGLRSSPAVLFNRQGRDTRLLWVVYVMSLVALMIAQLIPVIAATFGQTLPTLMGLGLIVSFLIPAVRFHRPLNQLVMTLLLNSPFIVLALGKGMKEELIFAVMPSTIIAWRTFRNPLSRISMVLAGVVFLGIITAYVGYYRDVVWTTKSDIPTTQVIRNFVDDAEKVGWSDTIVDGFRGFLDRDNSSTYRGLAVVIADNEKLHPELVFGPLTYVFIPRWLWPGKPEIRQGWEYSGLVYGQNYIAWSESSTAAGLYTSFYLGAGWAGVVLGAMGTGLLLAFCTRLAEMAGGTVAAGLYVFSLVPFAIRLDDTWSVGALTAPIISLVYLLVLLLVARLVGAVAFKRQVNTKTRM